MPPAIAIDGLVKTFGSLHALNGITMEVAEGTVHGLLGPNGAGKTTTVRVLSTLLRPDGGSATVGGYDVVRQAEQVRRLIALTGQFAAVDEYLTGRENIAMVGRLLGMARAQAFARADELLELFRLTDAAEKPVKAYSGGMRRRLDLAVSLTGEPRFLYLDEPTTGLDPRARRQVWDLIEGLADGGATVLLTTQYLDVADKLSDRIAVIDAGSVVAEGTPDELKETVGGRVVEVRVADDAGIGPAAKVLSTLTGAEPGIDRGARLLTAAIAETRMLAKATRALEDAKVEVDEIALRRPSLDEVFLALTGHRAESDEDETLEEAAAR